MRGTIGEKPTIPEVVEPAGLVDEAGVVAVELVELDAPKRFGSYCAP